LDENIFVQDATQHSVHYSTSCATSDFVRNPIIDFSNSLALI